MSKDYVVFSALEVCALLEGRKSQFRRIIKPQPSPSAYFAVNGNKNSALHLYKDSAGQILFVPIGKYYDSHILSSPFGGINNLLYIKEPFGLGKPLRNSEGIIEDEILWKGPLSKDPRTKLLDDWVIGYAADGCPGPFRPALSMPRWAARIFIKIIDLKVQQLQNISEQDAKSEGLDIAQDGSYRSSFESFWISSHGEKSWTTNPWVWILDFEIIDKGRYEAFANRL